MDAVAKQLGEIEKTAKSIVEHAEEQKFIIGQDLQHKRDEFDKELEVQTRKEIDQIRKESEDKMNDSLAGQRVDNERFIEALKDDFKENHTQYAKEIVKRITKEQ